MDEITRLIKAAREANAEGRYIYADSLFQRLLEKWREFQHNSDVVKGYGVENAKSKAEKLLRTVLPYELNPVTRSNFLKEVALVDDVASKLERNPFTMGIGVKIPIRANSSNKPLWLETHQKMIDGHLSFMLSLFSWRNDVMHNPVDFRDLPKFYAKFGEEIEELLSREKSKAMGLSIYW